MADRTGAAPRAPRVGLGRDRHRLAPGRRLVLGGVTVPSGAGLAGHSDADVLTHAVCDALLGALALPDLGTRFPDTDKRHRGRSSLEFVYDIVRDVRAMGYAIGNLDAVLMAESPRLAPHLPAMRRSLARALGCPETAVSVKVKRGEGLGFVGRTEGMEALAIALLVPAEPRSRARAAGAGPARAQRVRAKRARARSRRRA